VSVAAAHVVREVWRGQAGVLDRCQLRCTCGWCSTEAVDTGQLRSAREAHLAGEEIAGESSGADGPTLTTTPIVASVDASTDASADASIDASQTTADLSDRFPEDEYTVVFSVPPGWLELLDPGDPGETGEGDP